MHTSSWDARQLSLAGRVTLAQSVLLSIPSYFIQTMMIPKGLCDEIECIVRKFVWGSTNGNTKVALVNWDSVCQLKPHEGLGLRCLEDHNTSFMMKMGFKIISNVNDLWVQVIRSKYEIPSGLPENISRERCSFLWRSIAKVWPLVYENLLRSVGDSKSIQCWRDPWILNCGPLLSYIPYSSNLNMDCRLSNMIAGDGSWNLELFRLWIPGEIINKIVGIPSSHPSLGLDKIVWGATSTGLFFIKSAYEKTRDGT
ncbi:hypothetical protein CXB51_009247 [Gossypium anomalum]|uniref:Reverse transcriptase zinc-binding domain-containing protein n=1 Tax=Gossypium anomalum TaxID=47600 RepID=A0A8J6D288_9ROSI|nr:hypothetical protein CXB51_009247 [Gossypium anomalum]